jgi:hypothetical protein
MMVRIKAEPVLGKDLKPGELFSTRGADYWDHFPTRPSIGESVYIRTAQPPYGDGDEPVFRITVVTEET